MPNIIETASANNSLKTFVTAVKAAGLVETLSGTGLFTVFAPNDEAFAKLPEGTIEALLKDVPTLKQLLAYHVMPGKVMAADISRHPETKTVEGQSISLDSKNGIKVNDARVIKADVTCNNGVIHVINGVLTLPMVN